MHYREIDELGNHASGPMYDIKTGFSDRWQWLALLSPILFHATHDYFASGATPAEGARTL